MPRLEPAFIEAPSGRLFCLQVLPDGAERGVVFHLPAFGEEMNKARHMVLQGAWALASQGWRVQIVDPFGSGDSAGDFGEADWDAWVRDAVWFKQQHHSPDAKWIWWGLRSGALLAAAAACEAGGDGMLLWQPVVVGKQYLTQFLRLRLANDSLSGEGQTDTRQLREQLAAGRSLEVGGYMLSSRLAAGLEAADLRLPAAMPVAWLEVSARETPDLLPASRQRAEALQAAGHAVTSVAVGGAAFWQSLEISEVQALVAATCEALQDRSERVAA